ERRLRHVQAIGGPAEMQRLGQDEQRPEIVELHVHNQRLSDGAERFIGQNRTGRAILRPGDTSPMIDVNWSAAIGTAGTACSALSFLPQFLKVRRQGGRDLSAAMLALLLAGGGLWLAYGILNGATAVIVANTAVLILVSAVAGLKVIHATRARRLERRPRIAIDMGDVMADALAEHFRRYNAAYGANLGLADVQGRPLEECIPPGHRAAAEAMLDASFFEDLAVLPECQAVVRELAERYDVFIASAAMDVPCSFDAKYRWLRRHFPF